MDLYYLPALILFYHFPHLGLRLFSCLLPNLANHFPVPSYLADGLLLHVSSPPFPVLDRTRALHYV